MKKRIWLILFCVLFFFTIALPRVAAAESGAITVLFQHNHQPVEQAFFQIYKVAEWNGSSYTFISPFSDYPVQIGEDFNSKQWKALAGTLDSYAARDQLTALMFGETDASGSLHFDELEDGLYLVTGTAVRHDDLLLLPQPVLVTVPYMKEDGTADHEVVIEPKYDYRKLTEEKLERRVLKIWSDKDNKSDRPEKITVQLLCDGKVIEEQILDETNSWKYIWTNLDALHDWKVVEKEVPKEYTVQIEQQGITFTVTNTNDGSPSGPPHQPPTTIPHTGMLWWPVPVLAGIGAAALLIGTFLLFRKKENKNE